MTAEEGSGGFVAAPDSKIPVAEPVHPVGNEEDDLTGDPGGELSDHVEEYSSTFRNMQEEAYSLDHLMDHYPKNPRCHACQVGKIQPQQSRRSKGLGPPPNHVWRAGDGRPHSVSIG